MIAPVAWTVLEDWGGLVLCTGPVWSDDATPSAALFAIFYDGQITDAFESNDPRVAYRAARAQYRADLRDMRHG